MDAKLTLTFIVLLLLAAQDLVQAEFLYNRELPQPEELEGLGYKCIPGRTIIKIQEKPVEPESVEDDSSDNDGRRSHMRFKTDDEFCQVCVCSVEGKDQYCSKRPSMNVNECMRMAVLMDQHKKNDPFDHERTLPYRVRRDYVWHHDEIPYEAKAKCQRGMSYYSASMSANDTDIDVGTDITTLLAYENSEPVCYYCVCSVDGWAAGCIPRSLWYCRYYRKITSKEEHFIRKDYEKLFQQDRPAYFSLLSYRLRRTMDDGVFDLIESGGDALCCAHSDGHRRQLHHQVRNKIQMMRKRVNKENLMSGAPGGDYVDFVVNNDKKK